MSDLLAEQRREQIAARVRAEGAVRVGGLAEALSVSEETVRRDLSVLEEAGVLTRTHGGAIRRAGTTADRSANADLPFEKRRQAMRAAKRAIAQEALKRIRPGQTIALDGSTTAYELATLIGPIADLTVVTNSLMITTLLASRADSAARVICTGGSLDRELLMFTGMIALDGLRHLHVDRFFCSCGGIDPTRGFTDPSEAAAQFKRRLIEGADQTIVMADSTKFASRAPVVFAAPGDVDDLITDNGGESGSVASRLKRAGMRCTRVAVR